MGTHPNAILLLVLKPDGLARKTYRDIIGEMGGSEYFNIDGKSYNSQVMEENYDEDHQLSAEEGDILVWDCVTYGYGERISWGDLLSQKESLWIWAQGICERHACSFQIYVTANYW
jgi:hypothetical protein